MLRNYAAIVQPEAQIAEESHDDYDRRASGHLSQLERFDLIFSGTEQTSNKHQRRDTSVQEALACAGIAVRYLRRLISDKSFKQFYALMVEQAEEHMASLPYLIIDNLQGGLMEVLHPTV